MAAIPVGARGAVPHLGILPVAGGWVWCVWEQEVCAWVEVEVVWCATGGCRGSSRVKRGAMLAWLPPTRGAEGVWSPGPTRSKQHAHLGWVVAVA